ncbi:MAG: oligosaccharide flippase family protein [Nitrospirae bacterium]|nr:oligosaccharide flippase family protein [Candidatus Troglogloeales bacterium]
MTAQEKSDKKKRMYRDNWIAVLIGPFKLVIPTLSYAILYPLMISRTSVEVVGVWSLIASIITFIGVADIGFSQLLTRDAGPDRPQYLQEVHADYVTAERSYIAVLLVLILIFAVTKKYILASVQGVYSVTALEISVILVIAGSIIQLIGKLDAAILSARHDNYTVQIVTAVAPVFTYSAAIICTLLRRPIEGLAVGTVLSSVVTIVLYRVRLSRAHGEWSASAVSLSVKESVNRFFFLTRRGWYLYSSSIGMLIRGPVYRLIIASILGLQAVAVFDIAMRITQTVRELIASGFSVLYPTFAYLYRSGERANIIELIQVSLMVLLPFGAALLGLLIGASEPILSFWLGNVPGELVPATRVLAIWQIITLANVPFWYLLQATYNEKIAACSIWAHTAAIFLVIPLSAVYNFTVVDLMVYWTATSVVTQGLIYFYVQWKLSLLWDSILRPRILVLIVSVLLFPALSYGISMSGPDIRQTALCLGSATVVFILMMAATVMRPVSQFLKTGQIVRGL